MNLTRREAFALCAVAELALVALESAGLLDDDRPELCLAVVRRWCLGEATDDEIDDAARIATEAWEAAAERPSAPAYSCVDWLCLLAQDDLAGGVDAELRGYVMAHAVACLALHGEPRDAARARCERVFEGALTRVRMAG